MRLDFLVAADFAQADPSGKFNVVGGGVESIAVAAFPVVHPILSLLCRYAWEADDLTMGEMVVSIVGPNEYREFLEFRTALKRATTLPNETGTVVVTYSGLLLPKNGRYRFHVTAFDKEIGHRDIEVVLQSPPNRPKG